MFAGVSVRKKTNPFSVYKQTLDNGVISYSAGFPHYPRNFSRDTFIAGIIASSPELLLSQLEISADNQGKQDNSQTGEGLGRIHHELPGVSLEGRGTKLTTYDACDTTSLFLIAIEILEHLDQKLATDFINRYRDKIELAAKYVRDSVDTNNLFWERPQGHEGYALKVTYWKDSILPNPSGKTEPTYPVIYPQAHFIAARSLLSASRLLSDQSLAALSDQMYISGIKEFMKTDGYLIYRDSVDELWQTSSDELHSLAYIPSVFKDLIPLEAIRARAQTLKTPFGYMCTPVEIAKNLSDRYHGDTVWVFEQAMIHYGAAKFGLDEEMRTSAAIAELIGKGQELFGLKLNKQGVSAVPKGNSRQLWSVAASEYFEGRSTLSTKNWL